MGARRPICNGGNMWEARGICGHKVRALTSLQPEGDKISAHDGDKLIH